MTIRVDFDQPSYGPDDVIRFLVVVEGEPASVQRDVTFTGTVTTPSGAQPVTGTTVVVEDTVYGPFTADGYDVVQDPADPSQYTATPVGEMS